jgi:hypothetical protein
MPRFGSDAGAIEAALSRSAPYASSLYAFSLSRFLRLPLEKQRRRLSNQRQQLVETLFLTRILRYWHAGGIAGSPIELKCLKHILAYRRWLLIEPSSGFSGKFVQCIEALVIGISDRRHLARLLEQARE